MKYYGGFLVSGLLSLKGSLLAIKIFTIILCKLLYVFVCQINVLKLKIETLTKRTSQLIKMDKMPISKWNAVQGDLDKVKLFCPKHDTHPC